MGRKAGVIVISLEAGVNRFVNDMAGAGGAVRSFKSDAAPALREVGSSFGEMGSAAGKGLQSFEGLRAAAKGFLEIGATALAAAKGIAIASAQSEELLNVYRGLRLLLSPTLFTAGTIAAGVAIEETVKLVSAREKLIDQDAMIAARDNRRFSSIATFSAAGRISGEGDAIYDVLGKGLSPAEIVEAIDRINAIKDPVDRAREAVKLFGDVGAAALPLLNDNLKRTLERSHELASELDGPTRESLQRMSDTVKGIGAIFQSVADDIRYLREQAKQEIVIMVTRVERYVRSVGTPSAAITTNKKDPKTGKDVKDEATGKNVQEKEYPELYEPGFGVLGTRNKAPDMSSSHRPSDLEFWKMLLKDSGANIDNKDQVLSVGAPRVPGTMAYGPLLPGQVDVSVGSRVGAEADRKAASAYAASLEGVQGRLSAAKARAARLLDILVFSQGDTSLIDGQLAEVSKQVKSLEHQAKELQRQKELLERMSHFTAKFPENPVRPWGPSLYRSGEPGRSQELAPGTFTSSEQDRERAGAGAIRADEERLRAYVEGMLGRYAAGDLSGIDARIEATKRLTAAQLVGAEAERRARLEVKYERMQREERATPERINRERGHDELEHNKEVTAAALETGMAYQNRLERIGQEIAALKQVRAEQGDSLAIQISMRNLQNERLHQLAQESLQLRGARDGMRAFFLEMQMDAKSAAAIVYESLHSAYDRSTNLAAKMLTGQKADWAGALRDLGEQMVSSTLKSGAQVLLGKLGEKIFGKEDNPIAKILGLDGKKPTGAAVDPLWVRLSGGGDGNPLRFAFASGNPSGSSDNPFWVQVMNQGTDKSGGAKGAAASGAAGVLGGLLGVLLGSGGGGGGGGEEVTSSIDWGGQMAYGGSVEPGTAYTVGEMGPETFVPSTRGRIIPNGSFGAPEVHNHYHIDARGADLGAANRIARGIEASHNSAVVTAVQVQHERMKRTPR